MPTSQDPRTGKITSPAGELLEFRDELSALNACNAFVLRALADAMLRGEGMDARSATGATFCAQWLDERAVELERRLKNIQARAVGSDLESR